MSIELDFYVDSNPNNHRQAPYFSIRIKVMKTHPSISLKLVKFGSYTPHLSYQTI